MQAGASPSASATAFIGTRARVTQARVRVDVIPSRHISPVRSIDPIQDSGTLSISTGFYMISRMVSHSPFQAVSAYPQAILPPTPRAKVLRNSESSAAGVAPIGGMLIQAMLSLSHKGEHSRQPPTTAVTDE